MLPGSASPPPLMLIMIFSTTLTSGFLLHPEQPLLQRPNLTCSQCRRKHLKYLSGVCAFFITIFDTYPNSYRLQNYHARFLGASRYRLKMLNLLLVCGKPLLLALGRILISQQSDLALIPNLSGCFSPCGKQLVEVVKLLLCRGNKGLDV